MEYILILLMCIFVSAYMSLNRVFYKDNVRNTADLLYFNMSAFVIPALVFLPRVFDCSPAVWVYAALTAVFSVACFMLFTHTVLSGNLSLTTLIVNFAMVINVLVSFLFFKEPLSTVRIASICMIVVAFVIGTDIHKPKGNRRWLAFAVGALACASCACVVQKFFGASPYSEENFAFVSSYSLIVVAISLGIYMFVKKREDKTYKFDFYFAGYAVGIGVCLAAFQTIFTFCLARIDGTFLFPVQTGIMTILSVISGLLIFKARFSKRQFAGAVLAFISLVIMSY